MQGYGTYVWADKTLYKGEWMNGEMHGEGLFKLADGRYYQGAFERDKKEGYGEYHWGDGRSYLGQWVAGKQHGSATFVKTNGRRKQGIWENGKRIAWK